tara:strand:- start:1533 stop:1823 length:291 start_codon:yes stop_codon:yes gene_type:complete
MKKLLLVIIVLGSTGCQAIFDEHFDSLFDYDGWQGVTVTHTTLGFEGDRYIPAHVETFGPTVFYHGIDDYFRISRTVHFPKDGSKPIFYINGVKQD